jgi:hypothetical protein
MKRRHLLALLSNVVKERTQEDTNEPHVGEAPAPFSSILAKSGYMSGCKTPGRESDKRLKYISNFIRSATCRYHMPYVVANVVV